MACKSIRLLKVMAITVIKRKVKTRKIVTYDMEWTPGTPTYGMPSKLNNVRLIGAFDDEKGYRSYRTVRDFLKAELNSDNRGRWFYAHAGGLADVQFVLEEIWQINKEFNRCVFEVSASFSGSSAIIVHVKFKGSKAVYHFIDSFWLMRTSLANIGKWVGLEKGAAEKRRTNEEAKEYYTNAPIEDLREYNKRDCEILYKAISNFEDVLLDMGSQLQMTQASSAMQLFRRSYLEFDIPTTEYSNEVARKSYFASRVEPFTRRCSKANYFDINSSFPYAMTKPCPGALIKLDKNISSLGDDDVIFIAQCEIEVPDSYITSMPYRANDRVFFPSGRWKAWVTSVDLDLLLQEGGRLLKVFEVHHFQPFYDLAGYAKDIYAKRGQAEGFEREVYKILANSLYGKFAESAEKVEMIIDPPREILERMSEDDELMPGIFLVEKTAPVAHVHVPISSHITAFARRRLFEFIGVCKDVFYCDTDGFATTEELQTSAELGDIKLEKLIEKGHFVQAKLYHLVGTDDKGQPLGTVDNVTGEHEGMIKAKGFSRLNYGQFSELLEGKEIQFERMARLKDLYRRGETQPEEIMVKKRLNPNTIPKRFTYPDGQTRPWTVDEITSGDVMPDDCVFRDF